MNLTNPKIKIKAPFEMLILKIILIPHLKIRSNIPVNCVTQQDIFLDQCEKFPSVGLKKKVREKELGLCTVCAHAGDVQDKCLNKLIN